MKIKTHTQYKIINKNYLRYVSITLCFPASNGCEFGEKASILDYWLILRPEISFWGKTIVVAMVTKMVAMVTIVVAKGMEPVAMEFMAVA